MTTVILVPRREGFPDRDALWKWCRAWWERNTSYPIFEGHHTVGLFNRSAAINTAAHLADQTLGEKWTEAIVIDADIIVDPERLERAIAHARASGAMTFPFTHRQCLDRRGTKKVMEGYTGSWKPYVYKTFDDGCSSCFVVTRDLWDATGGFDEEFRGWGFEDNAFAAACITMSGQPYHKIKGDLWHLFHKPAPEGTSRTPTVEANRARNELYRAAMHRPDELLAIREIKSAAPVAEEGIPRIIHRTIPEAPTMAQEASWATVAALHQGWRLMTHQDPVSAADFPEVYRLLPGCANGAERADLIRLEALWRHGGFYLDSDFTMLRSLESLRPLKAVAAWEDANCVPNAFIGARPGHPAIRACLDAAIRRRKVRTRKPLATWDGGPGITTKILVGRDDVLLLPPGSFYPVHYTRKAAEREGYKPEPWVFGIHEWEGSWLPEEKRW